MKRICILMVAGLMLAACRSEQRPADVLAPEAMASLLADAYMLEGFYAVETGYRYDTMLPEVLAAYDDILARHHTTREAVEHSLEYYSTHPDQYKPVQDSVLALLDRAAAPADTLPATALSDIDLEVVEKQ